MKTADARTEEVQLLCRNLQAWGSVVRGRKAGVRGARAEGARFAVAGGPRGGRLRPDEGEGCGLEGNKEGRRALCGFCGGKMQRRGGADLRGRGNTRRCYREAARCCGTVAPRDSQAVRVRPRDALKPASGEPTPAKWKLLLAAMRTCKKSREESMEDWGKLEEILKKIGVLEIPKLLTESQNEISILKSTTS